MGTAALEAKLLQQLTSMREVVLFKGFLDLQKAYDALYWDIYLEIHVAHGVVPRTIQLLWKYWDRLTMVDRSGGYFGHTFKGNFSVTQGDLLSPTLFNVVVDVFIYHWVTVVVPTADGLEGRDLSVGKLAAYFYVDDGLVALNQPERLQRAFDALTSLFN